ncbi:MAG TPA: hypothetical protein VII06_13060 [Chloroflexota bacterium]
MRGIDADGHVSDSAAVLLKYLPEEFQHLPLMGSESRNRRLGGTLSKDDDDYRALTVAALLCRSCATI